MILNHFIISHVNYNFFISLKFYFIFKANDYDNDYIIALKKVLKILSFFDDDG
jgi:hypothetical protein